MSDLQAFLNPEPIEETKKIVISNRFKDNDGNPVPFVIRTIDDNTNQEMQRRCMKREKVRGQIAEHLDSVRYSMEIIIACTVFPDFKSAELCEHYGVVDPVQLPGKMLRIGELAELGRAIRELNGLVPERTEELEEEAKNS